MVHIPWFTQPCYTEAVVHGKQNILHPSQKDRKYYSPRTIKAGICAQENRILA